jgi:hypothetical protein
MKKKWSVLVILHREINLIDQPAETLTQQLVGKPVTGYFHPTRSFEVGYVESAYVNDQGIVAVIDQLEGIEC